MTKTNTRTARKQERKHIKLAIFALTQYRRQYYAYSASNFNPDDPNPLRFIVLGKQHWDEYTETIQYFEELLKEQNA